MNKVDFKPLIISGHIVFAKDGVNFDALNPRLVPFLIITRNVWDTWVHATFIVTSTTEGAHSAKSLHYKGLAFDVRSREAKPAEIERFIKALKRYTGQYFQIVIESDHIHFELDER